MWAYPVGGGPAENDHRARWHVHDSGIAAGNYDVEFYTYPCGGGNYATAVVQRHGDRRAPSRQRAGGFHVGGVAANDINAVLPVGGRCPGQ